MTTKTKKPAAKLSKSSKPAAATASCTSAPGPVASKPAPVAAPAPAVAEAEAAPAAKSKSAPRAVIPAETRLTALFKPRRIRPAPALPPRRSGAYLKCKTVGDGQSFLPSKEVGRGPHPGTRNCGESKLLDRRVPEGNGARATLVRLLRRAEQVHEL